MRELRSSRLLKVFLIGIWLVGCTGKIITSYKHVSALADTILVSQKYINIKLIFSVSV